MSFNRMPRCDPRTVARQIPGVLDNVFPCLNRGLVTYFNKKATQCSKIKEIPAEKINQSKLKHAVLFELSTARAEQKILGNPIDWSKCLNIAVERQRKHFDVILPINLETIDIDLAELAANNLYTMLVEFKRENSENCIQIAPEIPGFSWISSGNGDFSIGKTLVEVKHTAKKFSSRDFKQVLMYWILKYFYAIENNQQVWEKCLLLNPRKNLALHFKFDEVIRTASLNSSRLELCDIARAVINSHVFQA